MLGLKNFSLKNIARVFETPTHYVTKEVTGNVSRLADTFNDISHQMLPNGLFVSVRDNSDNTINMKVKVKTGARDDPPGKEGLAHITEHMAFMADGELEKMIKEFEKRGGEGNASTSGTNTTYSFSIPKGGNNEEYMYALSSRILLDDRFAGGDLEEEKNVVINEHQKYHDDIDGKVGMYTTGQAFGQDHISEEILGSVENVQNFSVADIEAFRRKWYAPSNMQMTLTGANTRSAYRKLQTYFGVVPWRQTPEHPANPAYKGGYRHIDNGLKPRQTYVATAFFLPQDANDEYPTPAEDARRNALASYLQAGLMDTLRGKKDRKVYTPNALVYDYKNQKVMLLYADTQPETSGALLPAIASVVSELASGKIDPERFNIAVAQAQKKALDEFDSTKHYSGITNPFDRWRDLRQAKKTLDALTPADLTAMVQVMMSKQPTMVTRGDISNVQSYDEFRAMLPATKAPDAAQQATPVPVAPG